MTTIERTVTVDRPLERVFEYLSDFTNTNEWDPGTVETVRVSGDGGVGTTYRNVTSFFGRKIPLTYVVEKLEPRKILVLRGEGGAVVAHDTLTFAPTSTGSTMTYRAVFDFKGVVKYLAPLMAPLFKRFGDDAQKGIQEALEKL